MVSGTLDQTEGFVNARDDVVPAERGKGARLQLIERRGRRRCWRRTEAVRTRRCGTEAVVQLVVVDSECFGRHLELKTSLLQGFDDLRLTAKGDDDIIGEVGGNEKDGSKRSAPY